MAANSIQYSEKYYDDVYEYRRVGLDAGGSCCGSDHLYAGLKSTFSASGWGPGPALPPAARGPGKTPCPPPAAVPASQARGAAPGDRQPPPQEQAVGGGG